VVGRKQIEAGSYSADIVEVGIAHIEVGSYSRLVVGTLVGLLACFLNLAITCLPVPRVWNLQNALL
jgi:hypothetical protein